VSAEIAGLVARHASRPRLTGPERPGALLELAELAAGRGDLLARCTGLGVGIHEGDLDEDATCGKPSYASKQAPTPASSRTGST
jgi:hypothetical protein